jgi:oligopeptide/dipeptide ABC transporter ATP-binding protein
MLEVKDLKKTFILNSGAQVRAVNGISLRVEENEVLGIVGESGCGKSTLGRLILRLIEPTEGKVFFNNDEITGFNRRELRLKRKSMQMVFQNPYASFNPKIRINGALTEVCRYYGMSAGESRDKIKQLLNDTGLSEDLLYRWPRELSGGQLQRLAIARSLLSDPSLVVADEALSALDVSIQAQLLNLLDELRASRSMIMIFISHDMTVVEYFCDRIAVMYLGRIMELLSASELSANAMHPYTRSLKAAVPRLDLFKDTQSDERSIILKGDVPNPTTVINGCPFAPRCPEATKRCSEELPELKEVSSGHWVRCWRS